MLASEYDIRDEIGQGAFGTVSLAAHRATQELAVVKQVSAGFWCSTCVAGQCTGHCTIHHAMLGRMHWCTWVTKQPRGCCMAGNTRAGIVQSSMRRRRWYSVCHTHK